MVLAALALVLSGPGPAWLARARWPRRVPRAALVLWQALALAALLSAVGAGLSVATLAVLEARPNPVVSVLYAAALAITLTVLARLLWSAHTLGVGLRARRRRHRELVDILGRPDRRAPGARVLDADPPFAYCVPGLHARLVVSSSALEALSDDEVRAVLEHERAHVRARHDLVLEGFAALRNAFPKVVRSRAALDSAAGLVEMLADDAARRRVGALPLGRALTRLAGAPVPAAAIGAGNISAVERIHRLAEPPAPLSRGLAAATYLAAAALVVVPTLTVAAPWLARLAAYAS
ncbi:M56 family metallopeptidase [Phytoactinopolyspora halotolerans]|uniref:M56 family metallopeptidase n=2 Tax=Phytoactinopolyspora halotolerans TaxID=1981512 RepID=A0A6L9S2S3_9ACTN|nr:M56 family metallopeptidase [Phytoactinopolyspora halotolerans]